MRRIRQVQQALWSTIVVLGTFVTIASGLPMAIQNAQSLGLSFLSNPNVLWAIGCFLFWLIGMLIIWRRTENNQSPLLRTHKLSVPEWMSRASVKVRLQCALFDEMVHFVETLKQGTLTEEDEQFARQMMRAGFKSRVEDCLGKEVRARYVKALGPTDQPSDIRITSQAAMHVVTNAVAPTFEAEAVKHAEHKQFMKDFGPLVKAIGRNI